MVWLGSCSKDITLLVILDEGTVDHTCYIKNVFLVALKYGIDVFSDNWIFQQDGAKPHRDHLREEWNTVKNVPAKMSLTKCPWFFILEK